MSRVEQRSELVEINFDGLIGPTHNYAGLSLGNLAATSNAGQAAHPRAAALQGIAKMRANMELGLQQGLLLPHPRPDHDWLAQLATDMESASPALQANAISASAMWAANAATVSPAPDTADGRCHLTVANLVTMPHRSHEWPFTLRQLETAFADDHFRVHPPVPAPFGDEGAANHMRLAPGHGSPGIEIFVHGMAGGPFPARQHIEASRAIARRHGLDPARTLFVQQSPEAIAAGAFHNDVVAVADGMTLLAHEQAFADKERFYESLTRCLPGVHIIEVPAARLSLAQAVRSYLFNAQLVTLPDGSQSLIVPRESEECAATRAWLASLLAGNGPIRRVNIVDVRESMANGGGPACLRLRIVADPARIDPRFMMTPEKLDLVAGIVTRFWPETANQEDIGTPSLWNSARTGLLTLVQALGINAIL